MRIEGRITAPGLAGMAVAEMVLAAVVLGGCSGGQGLIGGAGSVTGYTAGNSFLALGYRSKEIDPTHHTIVVTGTPHTPAARLERIALARAAEIGKENNLGAFKVESLQAGVECGKRTEGYKGPGAAHSDYARVVLSAVYSATAPDPSWQPSAATFDKISAELTAEIVSPEDSAAAAREIAARCGRR